MKKDKMECANTLYCLALFLIHTHTLVLGEQTSHGAGSVRLHLITTAQLSDGVFSLSAFPLLYEDQSRYLARLRTRGGLDWGGIKNERNLMFYIIKSFLSPYANLLTFNFQLLADI